MDIYKIRSILKQGKTIQDLHMRVVYYARVSTEKDEQLNSLSAQQSYYEDFIAKNPNWRLVGRYVDEGLSGISVAKRKNFHAMISDAEAGAFDFVITKEISRFARNTLDSIHYTRTLLLSGVAVWFQQDNINTIDEDSELRLSIMSSLAQEESRRMSSRISFGHRQAIKKGTVLGNSLIYGYTKENGKLVIDEAQAPMIQTIFELYATGDWSTPKLEKLLYEQGYKNRHGGAISRNNIRKIIANPKYKGFYCGNKVKVIDMFSKKQHFLSEDDWELYKDHDTVPPIVDEATWERANRVMDSRSNAMKGQIRAGFKGNLFTGKIICADHNTPFYLKARKIHGKEDETWVCSHRIKNGKDSCNTFGIKEVELKAIVYDVLTGVSSNIDSIVDDYIGRLKKENGKDTSSGQVLALQKSIDVIFAKKDKLLDLSLDGRLSNAEFELRNNALNEELAEKEAELSKCETAKSTQKELDSIKTNSNLMKFKKDLITSFANERQELTPGILNAFIEKIIVEEKSSSELILRFVLGMGAEVLCSYKNNRRQRPKMKESLSASGS